MESPYKQLGCLQTLQLGRRTVKQAGAFVIESRGAANLRIPVIFCSPPETAIVFAAGLSDPLTSENYLPE